MTRQFEEETGRAGDPFLRLLQPQEPNAPFAESSYFRLGSYVSYNSEEDPLVTHLTTTRSRVSTDPAVPGDPVASTRGVCEQAFADALNAPSLGSRTNRAIPSSPIQSSNDGILIYTDRDLNENVRGAVMQKYGQGHVTEITDCDSAYSVKNGKHDLYARNGIDIHAGTVGVPSNINIIAQGHITQIAYGDLKEKTVGNSHKQFIGDHSNVFVGTQSTLMVGSQTTANLSTAITIQLGYDSYIRLGGRFTFTFSTDLTINVGLNTGVTMGIKSDTVVGVEFKLNARDTYKYVMDHDYSYKTRDYKILYVYDIVVCPGATIGIKNRVLNMSNFTISKEKAEIKTNEWVSSKTEYENKVVDLYNKTANVISIENAAIKLFK